MADLIATLVTLADEGPRGATPDEGGGAAIIVGIVALVILGAALLWLLMTRVERRRTERAGEPERPHRRGHVGRV